MDGTHSPGKPLLRRILFESGLTSLYQTGCDAWCVVLARTCRMFAFGGVSLIMALFFSELGFTDFQIGLFMTLTLAGDVLFTLALSFLADSLGRRRILFAGGFLMAVSGLIFAFSSQYWILLLAAVFGVVSATGGDFGPFRAIEESILSHLTSSETRADVLAWFVTSSTLGSAFGTAVCGHIVEVLRVGKKWSADSTYHFVFWIYVLMGFMNMFLAFMMSGECELQGPEDKVTQGSGRYHALVERSTEDTDEGDVPLTKSSGSPFSRTLGQLPSISQETRHTMYKLWFLLTVDSLADGMVSYTLTNYYMSLKFDISKSALGNIMSTSYLLGAISTIFAGPLTRHLGLINTMVFTHLPSSVAVLCFPAPSGLIMTVILLFIRTGLNNMDQAPRTAFIAAVVKPSEQTAIMGITAMLRTLASATGPTITGFLAGSGKFWIAFVAAGALRIAYDLGLWAMFIGTDFASDKGNSKIVATHHFEDDEFVLELGSVNYSPSASPAVLEPEQIDSTSSN